MKKQIKTIVELVNRPWDTHPLESQLQEVANIISNSQHPFPNQGIVIEGHFVTVLNDVEVADENALYDEKLGIISELNNIFGESAILWTNDLELDLPLAQEMALEMAKFDGIE